jgi:hypothetical protein
MLQCRKLLILAFALGAPAQDLPQWVILLARVKAHLRQELARLTDCVCLETVRRDYRPAGGKMRPLDTIRLEVLSTGRREMFASPGDRKFTEAHPAQFSAGGVIGDGLFALLLSDIAAEHGPSFEYRGFEDLDGHRLARFDYRVPLMISGHSISVDSVRGTVGTKGSFWADEKSFDVLRLEVHAEDIPPSLPIVDAVTTVDYARMRLGERDMLLPVGGDYWQSKFSGEEHHNRIEFTHCRLFAAESSISFGPEDPGARTRKSEVVARDSEVARDLPAALLVTTRLSSPLTNEMAVGEMLEGVVAGKVSYRGNVLIEDGAKVHGRIRRMERHTDGGAYFIVAVEFTELESAGGRYRFYADLQDLDRPEGVEWALRKGNGNVTETTYLTDLPGVGSFFVRSSKVGLPKGFRMVWRTRALTQ